MNWETTQENSVILRLNWLFAEELFTKQENCCYIPTHGADFPALPYNPSLLQLISLHGIWYNGSLAWKHYEKVATAFLKWIY